MKSFYCLLLLLCLARTGYAEFFPLSDPENEGGWTVYEPMTDEFDGDQLNPLKWQKLSWTGRMPVYHALENVAVTNGEAVLTTDWYTNGPQSSLSMDEFSIAAGYFRSNWARRYGYFEIRMKALGFPIVTGWWMTGGSSSYTREIDMLESGFGVPGERETKWGHNYHIWKTPTLNGVDEAHSAAGPPHIPLSFKPVDEYHTYGFEWDKDSMTLYLDGEQKYTRDTDLFQVGQVLMIGNEFNKSITSLDMMEDETDNLPTAYRVDYVRAWIKPETDRIWYVDNINGSDSNSGGSWSEAKKTIQTTINAAYDGDEIWVAAGHYKQYATFFGMHNMKMYGGFLPGAETLEERNPIANETILESPRDGRSTIGIKGVNGLLVDGFTVKGTTFIYDHAIDIEGACTNVVIANCRIMENNPKEGGAGGGSVEGIPEKGLAHARFENCEFSKNKCYGKWAGSAAFGARFGATVELINCSIVNNHTSGHGGAFSMHGGEENTTVRLRNCIISGNSNAKGSGAISQYYGTVDIADSIVADNSGHGIRIYAKDHQPVLRMNNSVVTGNGGRGIRSDKGTVVLTDNLFYDNDKGSVFLIPEEEKPDPDAEVDETATKEKPKPIVAIDETKGNREADPMFKNPALNDFSLLPDSPLVTSRVGPTVDSGTNSMAWPYDGVRIFQRPTAEGPLSDNRIEQLLKHPRCWKSKDGKQTTVATFVRILRNKVYLKVNDRKEISVPINMLSQQDRELLSAIHHSPKVVREVRNRISEEGR